MFRHSARAPAIAVTSLMLLVAACSTDSVSGSGGGSDGRAPLTTRGSGIDSAGSAGRTGTLSADEMRERIATIGDRVWFEYDRSDLNPVARKQIERWAEFVRQYPDMSFTIEGHCDERGTREYNLALGERRAAAAKLYLVSLGVDARRVATVSYGKERPAVVGSVEQAWAQNRRAVLAVQ